MKGPVQVLLERSFEEPCVQHWLSRYLAECRKTYWSSLKAWLLWFWAKQRESNESRISGLLAVQLPSEMLAYQERTEGKDRFMILDLMIDHVEEKGGTESSMIVRLSNLRSFFLKNRVDIPSAPDWDPHPTREPTKGNLTLDKVQEIVTKANLRGQAVFLTMLQGMMDKERFYQFNLKYAQELTTHLQSKRLDEPFRIDFLSGRKRNKRPFHSIPSYSPIIIKTPYGIDIIPISELWNLATTLPVWLESAQMRNLQGIFVKNPNNNGWVMAKRIIRHPYEGQLIRVNAHSGLVDASPNHSMITWHKKRKRITHASSIHVGDRIFIARNHLTCLPHKTDRAFIGSNELAWLYGLFAAEGTANAYTLHDTQNRPYHVHQTLVSNKDSKILDRARSAIAKELHQEAQTSKRQDCTNLIVSNKTLSSMFRKMFYTESGQKRVPREILNAPSECQSSFLQGYFDGDGTKAKYRNNIHGYDGFTTNSQVLASGILYLLRLEGTLNEHRIYNYASKPSALWIYFSSVQNDFPNVDEIKTVRELPYSGYLFDIETDFGTFCTGVGDVEVHNTFIYHDALQAWEVYFNRIRGWPKANEPIALERGNKPLSKAALYDSFSTIARQLRIKPPRGKDMGHRTGVAPHEAFRDVIRSYIQKARRDKFDTMVGEFFMGHRVDPYNYLKFHELEPEYVLENAKIAAKYLNIISNTAASQENTQEIVALREALEDQRKKTDRIEQLMTEFQRQILTDRPKNENQARNT